MNGFESGTVHVRIALRRDDAGVPEQFLNGPQIRAPLQQVRGKRMSQGVRPDRLRDTPCCGAPPQDLPHALPGQASPTPVQK